MEAALSDSRYRQIEKAYDRAIARARKAKGKRLTDDRQEAILDRVCADHGISGDLFFFETVRRNLKR